MFETVDDEFKMAACPSKDRDSSILTAELASASSVSLINNVKPRSKLLPSKLNQVNCHKKQQKKVAEVRLDNLQDAELQALLDEVVQYRGKKDGEKGTELFQALLRETQESGEESPPAFRPTQNTNNPSSAQHRRRRSRKEASGPFSHPTTGTPPSVQSNTVAGNNRKGGSLQNISSHSQSEWGCVLRRKRHDTSDSGAGPGSPRKREGGSLPCDVARGFKELDEQPVSITRVDRHPFPKDCVINMEGVIEDRPSSELFDSGFSQSWSPFSKSSERSCLSGSVEPMEQEMDFFQHSSGPVADDSDVKKKLLSKNSKDGKEAAAAATVYGSIQEVDCPITLLSRHNHQNSAMIESRPKTMNGTADTSSSNILQRRLNISRIGDHGIMDENGNPLRGLNGPHFTTISSLTGSRTSPPTTTVVTLNTQSTTAAASGKLRPKNKKARGGKDGEAVLSDSLPGHLGDRDVNELLQYIESSESNVKKNGEKKNGPKQNNIVLLKETSNNSKVNKHQQQQQQKKSTGKLMRQSSDSIRQDSTEYDSDSVSSPPVTKEDGAGGGVGGKRTTRTTAEVVEDFEASLALAADFQTVTKKQKRKKRNNSLSNSMMAAGGAKSHKELFDGSGGGGGGGHFFYNASSPSVMMRHHPSPHAALSSGGGSGSSGNNPVLGSGATTMTAGVAVGGDVKKLVASVPPSEPSDVDSDGGDSVHSLPIQPSAPLFPPSYADIITRSNSSVLSGGGGVGGGCSSSSSTDVSFLAAEASQPVGDDDGDVAHNFVVAAAVFPLVTAAHVPSNQTASNAKLSGGGGSGIQAPLRRAASLPPASPSVDTPPVVIVGSSSSTQVDVTFGFELNEQLLALSMQPSPTSSTMLPNESLTTAVVSSDPVEPEQVATNRPPPADEVVQQPAQTVPIRGCALMTKPDFAARYKEHPDLLNSPVSRRSFELVDFISQTWKRIEIKLVEQRGSPLDSCAGLKTPLVSSGIRVYTMD